MAVTTFILACLAGLRIRTVLLDTSCFYGTNIEALTGRLPKEFLEQSKILMISEDPRPEYVISELIAKNETKAILIDDLNALNALISSTSRKSSTHELFVLIRMLSYKARINNIVILTTAYRNQRTDTNSRRTLAASADLQIDTEAEPSRIIFRCNVDNIWPNRTFVAAIYPLAFKT